MLSQVLLVASLCAGASPQAGSAAKSAFLADLAKSNTSAKLDVDVYGDGTPALVLGRFDVGSSLAAATTNDGVVSAVSNFIAAHPVVYGAGNHARIVVTSIVPGDDLTFSAFIDQASDDGLRLWYSDLVAIFWNDGTLHGLVGHVRPAVDAAAVAASPLSGPDVLAVIGSESAPAAEVVSRDFALSQDGPFTVWAAGDKRRVERGYDPETGAITWLAVLPSANYFVDEQTRTVAEIVRNKPATTMKSCNLRHPDHPRDGNGRATSVFNESGTFLEHHNCTADESSGTCNFRLQYHPSGVVNTVDKVIDRDDNTFQNQALSCSTGAPAFVSLPDPNCGTCFNGDLMRQQTGYWGVSIEQTVATARVWASVAPTQQDWVHPMADNDTFECGGFCVNNSSTTCTSNSQCSIGDTCRANSCTDTSFTHNIYLSSVDSAKVDVWMHEYGHYVVWTYHDHYYVCHPLSDEGAAVHETWADIFGELSAADENTLNPDYGALLNFGNTQAPAADKGTSSRVVFPGTITCSDTNAKQEHEAGVALEQALWEVLFNTNCQLRESGTHACSNTMSYVTQTVSGAPDEPLWPGVSTNTQMTYVAAADGFAMLNSPYFGSKLSTTMALWYDYIVNHNSSLIYSRVAEVLVHHGFSAPH